VGSSQSPQSLQHDGSLFEVPQQGMAGRRAAIMLASEPASLSEARSFVAAMLDMWGREDPDAIVPLLTSEIISNAVRHAAGSVNLEVSLLNGDELRVQARDESPDSPVIRRSNPGGVGGHGLAIIESLARRWGVERHAGCKVVWFETRVPPRAHGRADGSPVSTVSDPP
jgi:anti-sigma regulatory factor (Ser/Thr protein kinase)